MLYRRQRMRPCSIARSVWLKIPRGIDNRQTRTSEPKYRLSKGSKYGINQYPNKKYRHAAANPTATAARIQSDSFRGSAATSRARAQLHPINPRLLRIMGHNITVASSPLAVGPKLRAVKIPVINPQNWIAKLVENVAIFALEKIILGTRGKPLRGCNGILSR